MEMEEEQAQNRGTPPWTGSTSNQPPWLEQTKASGPRPSPGVDFLQPVEVAPGEVAGQWAVVSKDTSHPPLQLLKAHLQSISTAIRERLVRLGTYVPYTQAHRRRWQNGVRSLARTRIANFNNLKIIDPITKRHLRPAIIHHETFLATLDVRFLIALAYLDEMVGITFPVLVYGGALVLMKFWLPIHYWDLRYAWLWPGIYLLYFAIWRFTYIFVFGPTEFLQSDLGHLIEERMRAKRLNRAAPFLFSWMGVTAVMISSLLYNIVATPRTGSVIPLIYATSAALLTILYLQLRSVVSILMYFITAFIGRRNFVTRPDSVLVDSLLGILSLCETEPWTRLETKRRLMLALEGIAQCVERDLPRQLRSGDVVTDVWVKTTTGQMAAYFRYLKKWVVTPSLATRHDFMQCIAQCLSHAAAGDWNALPRQDPDKYSQPQFLFQAVTVGRVVVSGVLPILAFWIVQLTPLKIEGIFEDYIKVGVLIWAILSGLSAIDPLLNTKLEALKDITGLLPIAGKKK